MPSLGRYFAHAGLALLPAFALWWFSLQTVLLPSLFVLENQFLQWTYERAQARLISRQNGMEWHLDTRLLTPEQPKTPGRIRTWSARVGNPALFTLGLPLAWMLLLASPRRRLAKTLLATLILLFGIVLALGIKVNLTMTQLLTAETPFKVYVDANLQLLHDPLPVWPSLILGYLNSFFVYFLAVGLPALLSYLFNRQWWHELFAGKELQ